MINVKGLFRGTILRNCFLLDTDWSTLPCELRKLQIKTEETRSTQANKSCSGVYKNAKTVRVCVFV